MVKRPGLSLRMVDKWQRHKTLNIVGSDVQDDSLPFWGTLDGFLADHSSQEKQLKGANKQAPKSLRKSPVLMMP